jgi:hypothetical protein
MESTPRNLGINAVDDIQLFEENSLIRSLLIRFDLRTVNTSLFEASGEIMEERAVREQCMRTLDRIACFAAFLDNNCFSAVVFAGPAADCAFGFDTAVFHP